MFAVKKVITVDEALSAFNKVLTDLKYIVTQNETEATKIEDDIKALKDKREYTYSEIDKAKTAIKNIGAIVGVTGE